jgi:ATP-binding cassette subfamily C (CFTR/MRP) protein 1
MTAWTVEIFRFMAPGVLLFSAEKLMTGIIPFRVVTVFVIQRVSLQTSRQLRFMDLESKSPVYSQFLETVGYH